MTQKQPQNVNLNLTDDDIVLCTECGHDEFTQTFKLAKISSIYTGNGKPGIVPGPNGFQCSKCGTKVSKDSKSKKELQNSDRLKESGQLSLFGVDNVGGNKTN